jgi:hypothetical protein
VALALFTRYCHCGRLPACTTCQVYVSNVQETRYHVIGAEMQVVNVELKPGDSKLCENPHVSSQPPLENQRRRTLRDKEGRHVL